MGGLSAGVVFLAPAPPGLRLLCSPQATGFFECLLRIVRRVCLDFSNPLGEDHPRELQGVRAPLRSGSSTYQSRAGPPRAACRSASRLIIDPRLPSHPASWRDGFGVTQIPNPGWRRDRCRRFVWRITARRRHTQILVTSKQAWQPMVPGLGYPASCSRCAQSVASGRCRCVGW